MRRLTGTHLTIIIVAAMVCLALPVAAVGAKIAKVSISGSNGKTAKVKAGKLAVNATVPGTVKTAQQGSVTTELAKPADYYYNFTTNSSSCHIVATAPAGRDLVVRLISVNVYANPSPGVANNLFLFRQAGCVTPLRGVNPTAIGVTDLTFDPGLGLKSGTSIYAKTFGNVNSESTVTGYLVPAGSVPPGRPSPSKPGPNAS